MHLSIRTLICVGVLLAPLGAAAQEGTSVLFGRVVDAATGQPLGGVVVQLPALSRSASTDDAGVFRIANLSPGLVELRLARIGFAPISRTVTLRRGQTTNAEFQMTVMAAELPEVAVTGHPGRDGGVGRDAFESRRALGFGKFYDGTMLREKEHLQLHDLLRQQGGVSVELRRVDGTRIWVALNPNRRDRSGLLDCPMQVYWNGTKLGSGGVLDHRTPDLRSFAVSSLDGVEVYRSTAQVPTEYGGPTAACGVILLWSRQGPGLR